MTEQNQQPVSDETQLSDATHLPSRDDTTGSNGTVFPSLPNRGGGQPIDDGTILSSLNGSLPDATGESEIGEETVLSASAPQTAFPAETSLPMDDGTAGSASGQSAAQPASAYDDPAPAMAPTAAPATATPSATAATPAAPASATTATTSTTSAAPTIMREASPAIRSFQRDFTKLTDNISKVVVGKPNPIKLCVTALMVGGHVLLEDNPGTGKTQLARGLANSIETSFKRIQFTPDLLPSDVVGVTFYDQKSGEFEFRRGPVFASIVLADEINRASPKTQSALLEVMEEQKTTVDGKTYDMPQPFIVIATQNPLEQLGTYKLPEAQMDRFLIKTSLGAPSRETAIDILKQIDVTDRANAVSPVLDEDDILRMRRVAGEVHVDEHILEYIERLVEATRLSEKTKVGSSMRGALALTRCARIWAAADGRGYVIPDDVRDLAGAVLAHRINLTAEAAFKGEKPEDLIDEILEAVPVPTIGA
ncbi:MoxR family ATPase [Bifidobacterium sp. ESL0763]|uniref:AAA family ATPase n=1 Tax=Bifidobacterium sp. ESL0763 TaxID=2983227 RepID=UPI0023F7AFCA|nr:MoxR family ATPase [Bifidobacterium sp. ESL0763]MDF7664287.1 MoxR family ATPase [Bifidobacterium sp. ESL0763]